MDGATTETRQIDLSVGMAATDVEVAVQLVLGAVRVDQPLRVGLWQMVPGWENDLETFSRGDR